MTLSHSILLVKKQHRTCSLLLLCLRSSTQISWRGNFHTNSIIYTPDTCIILVHTYRVQSEVDEVLGIKGYVSTRDLEKLEYTEQVI